MKKNTFNIIATSIFAAISSPALAVVGGIDVSSDEAQQYVEMNCSGTIIGGGKYVLTAAHCAEDNGLIPVTLFNGETVDVISQHNHPDYIGTDEVDISIWKLEHSVDINATGLVDLTQVTEGEEVELFGFGGTAPKLNKATLEVTTPLDGGGMPIYADNFFRALNIGKGSSTGGDSGGSYIDKNGRIRGVHRGYDPTSYHTETDTYGTIATHVSYANDLILDLVNGWNYPTSLELKGVLNVEVQSMHRGGVSESAYTEGDLIIDFDSSTCDDQTLDSFDICTYSVSSSGGHGYLYLTPDERIEFNKPVEPTEPTVTPEPPKSGGSSGGSLGFFTLLSIIMMGMRRKSN